MIKKSIIVFIILITVFLAFFYNKPLVKKGVGELQLRKICELPVELYETSGIIFYQSILWSINDSGNQPILYGIDTANCKVQYRIILKGVLNNDWEAISQDKNYIYIGDIGNNSISRTSFQIYKIAKDSIKYTENQVLENFSTIEFIFNEENSDLDSEFDAEAMLVRNDSIIIFTKDWIYYKTTAIVVPNKDGKAEAKVYGSFDVEGLVTAGLQSKDGKLYILGYADYIPFLQIIDSDILLQDVRDAKRFELSLYQGMQAEAITEESGQYFISCEGSYIEQGLYEIIF